MGALTGIAAFFGLLMNVNYLFAGTVSPNPILAICCLGIVMAWRIAGWYGLDRWLLPALGKPWSARCTRRAVRGASVRCLRPRAWRPPSMRSGTRP